MDLPRDDRGAMGTKINAIAMSLKSDLRPRIAAVEHSRRM